jgi:hypothetical protein
MRGFTVYQREPKESEMPVENREIIDNSVSMVLDYLAENFPDLSEVPTSVTKEIAARILDCNA